MPKGRREETGLRPDGPAHGYSGGAVLAQMKDVLFSALAEQYPARGDFLPMLDIPDAESALKWIYPRLEELEAKLTSAENLREA
jgi:hypothetical protein